MGDKVEGDGLEEVLQVSPGSWRCRRVWARVLGDVGLHGDAEEEVTLGVRGRDLDTVGSLGGNAEDLEGATGTDHARLGGALDVEVPVRQQCEAHGR